MIDVCEIQRGSRAPSPGIWCECDGIAAPMTADDASAVALIPASTTAGGRLPALRACLKRARMRSRIGSMLRGTVVSLVAALVLLCGLEVLVLYFNMAAPTALLATRPGHPLFYLALGGAQRSRARPIALSHFRNG